MKEPHYCYSMKNNNKNQIRMNKAQIKRKKNRKKEIKRSKFNNKIRMNKLYKIISQNVIRKKNKMYKSNKHRKNQFSN